MGVFDWLKWGRAASAIGPGRTSFGIIISHLLGKLCHSLFHLIQIFDMLRAALFQSVRYASRSAIRLPLPTSRIVTPCLSVRSALYSPQQLPRAARWYSAPAGLSKQEVEGRIMDLLKGFDKVRLELVSRSLHYLTDNQVTDQAKVRIQIWKFLQMQRLNYGT